MSSAILSDVEARAQRRRTRTRAEHWQELVELTWRRARDAADPADALRWLERAHRLVPDDDSVALALAGTRLRQGQVEAAGTLFGGLAQRSGTPEAWIGLGTCAHLLHDVPRAILAAAAALRCCVPPPNLLALLNAIAPAWCSLTTQGILRSNAPITAATLDGHSLPIGRGGRRITLPTHWRTADVLAVEGRNGPMLGSPLPIRPFAAVEGFVEAHGGGVTGWAWHPADPARQPSLLAVGPLGQHELRPEGPAGHVRLVRPLARPHAFTLSAAMVAELGEPVALLGPDGRHLLGSPLEPGLEARAAAGVARDRFAPIWTNDWTDIRAGMAGAAPPDSVRRPAVAVVIPVYRGATETLACVHSVLAGSPRGTRIIVVNDASPDRALTAALAALARRRRITLIRLPENRGFPGAANAGLHAASGHDVVLLNSDTLVPPGWLPRLRAAAYSAPGIATATPLTNDGTILNYPDPEGGNPVPSLPDTVALDTLAQQANAGQTADLPVGVGFCLFIRRAALDAAGPLREDLFAQGYGEENDFCLRARHHGFRHVAALDVFVAHVGAVSFGGARDHLLRRNAAILERLHPGYNDLIARHHGTDPLLPARRRIDALRWAAAHSGGGQSGGNQGNGGNSSGGAVILVTHGNGGGVDRVVRERADAVAALGQRPIVLRPVPGGLRVEQPGGPATPNLRFPMPDGLPELVRLLRRDRPRRVELHHLLGHHHAVAGLARALGVEAVSVVHDYARFCPRIALVSTNRHYCGEPDIPGCEACVADLGSLLEDDPPVRELLARSARELRAAARVIAPSADAAARIRRHFPGVAPDVEPWEDDAALPPALPAPRDGPLRVATIGAIGVEKGFEVLLACARDARARSLPIEFVVVGFTADDERLLAAGPVFITGEYREQDCVPLIQAQRAHLALIPSVWPETWCFALSRAWQAGLPAAVFDLGAPAERVRRGGRGWVLPFGMTPRALNDALLRLAPNSRGLQCPPPPARPAVITTAL